MKLANSIDSVQSITKSRKHSEKPAEFRNIIDRLSPGKRKIELFARHKAAGWDAWGKDAPEEPELFAQGIDWEEESTVGLTDRKLSARENQLQRGLFAE